MLVLVIARRNAADNLLTGQLPQQMDAFNVLELYLMNNHLQGPLPEGLGSIQYMYASAWHRLLNCPLVSLQQRHSVSISGMS